MQKITGCRPTLKNLYVRKRCRKENNAEFNISLSALIKGMEFSERVNTEADLNQLIDKTPHTSIGAQYELLL